MKRRSLDAAADRTIAELRKYSRNMDTCVQCGEPSVERSCFCQKCENKIYDDEFRNAIDCDDPTITRTF